MALLLARDVSKMQHQQAALFGVVQQDNYAFCATGVA
jgi:hypothetical protein